MLHRKKQVSIGSLSRPGRCFGMRLGLACVCMAVMAPLAGIAQSQNGNAAPRTDKVTVPVSGDMAQNITAPAGQQDMKAAQKNLSAAVVESRKELADDGTKLLALAVSLKTEVDKTNRNTLSIAVIRKAEQIEKLAHNVKVKLKQNDGGN